MGEEKLQRGFGAFPEGGGLSSWEKSIYELLALGYPRLALARAQGIPFVPYYINLKTTFNDPSQPLIPDVASDVKIVADTIIDQVVARVTRDRTPLNVLQPQSDFYYGFQSGIELRMNVVGMPRPAIVPKFTPLSNFCDVVNGSGLFPKSIWVMTYQQQLQADFRASIQLSHFPTSVCVTFRCFTPATDKFDGVNLTDKEALIRLQSECGIVIPDCYVTACKS